MAMRILHTADLHLGRQFNGIPLDADHAAILDQIVSAITSRDVDVLGFKGDELRIVECKAYHKKKSLLPEDVSKFFCETVPAAKKQLRQQHRSFETCKAEIWTTGPIGEKAQSELNGLSMPSGERRELVSVGNRSDLFPQAIRSRGTELLKLIAAPGNERE